MTAARSLAAGETTGEASAILRGVAAWRRIVGFPLGAHLAVLAVVLLALVPLLDDGLYSADEAAALAQIDLVERTGEWTAANPDPVLDPEAEALPLELAFRAEGGRWAPFAKNAAWLDLLRASRSVAGDHGPQLVSVVSAWLAALAAALLARRLVPAAPGVAVATAWLAGAGSPLLVDAYLTMGHTLAAALAGFAALTALGAADRDAPAGRRIAAAVVAGLLALATGMVRSEGVLFAVALGGAVVVASAVTWRRPDGTGTVLGALVAAAGPAAYVLADRVDLARWGPGIGQLNAGERVRVGGLQGRFQGFVTTWLNPAYQGASTVGLLAVVGVAMLWAAAVLVRRRGDPNLVGLLAVAGAAIVALRLLGPARSIPGLLVTLPALLGLVGLDRATAGSRPGRLLLAGWWLFALAVLATQYSDGGGGEWGGRYFALGLPLVLPPAVAGLRSLVRRAPDVRSAQVLVGALALATVSLSVGGVLALRAAQHASQDLVADVAAARLDAGVGGTPAVVLTTRGTVGRFSWEVLPAGGIHTVARSALDRYAARLAERGLPVVFYGDDLEAELPILRRHFEVESLGVRTLHRLDPLDDP